MNLAALLRVFTRDLYEFDLYDLFLERISRTNRGIPVIAFVLPENIFTPNTHSSLFGTFFSYLAFNMKTKQLTNLFGVDKYSCKWNKKENYF